MRSITTLAAAIIILFLGASCLLAEPFTVIANIANVRSGPGTKYDLIWKVEKYHPVNVIEKKGKWYRFKDFENDEGWMHKSLLDNVPAVISLKDKCNVRSGAGTKYDILFTVDKGIPFKVIGRKGKWLNIQHHDGDKGWIHQSLVWQPKLWKEKPSQ
jgi:SH3-like domain-containing protein